MNKTIIRRQNTNKELLLEQLKKTPIVQVACEKVGVARASYYRWRKRDNSFAQKADQAILDGNFLVNDLAESQLINSIKNNSLGAIVFWLKHHHPNYATKVEVTAHLKHQSEVLTAEQEALVEKALQLASLLPKDKEKTKEEEKL